MPRPVRVLVVLLVLDLGFVALHVAQGAGWVTGERFRLDTDAGWAECFQSAKAAAVAVLLWRRNTALMRTWALLFVYLAVDDLLRVHETLGGRMGQGLGLPRGYHTGQIVYAGLVAAAFAAALGRCWGGASEPDRRTSWRLLMAVFALGLVGVGLDFVYSALLRGSADALAILLEEGGEHVALSIAVALSIPVVRDG